MIQILLLAVGMTVSGNAQASASQAPWKRIAFDDTSAVVSALAIDEGNVAVGLSSGGVRLVDPAFRSAVELRDPLFGDRGRILDLAWSRNDLWIASAGGLFRYDASAGALDRARREVPPALRTGVKTVLVGGGRLWCASSAAVSVHEPGEASSYREWKLPVEADPSCMVLLGGRILVGTSGKGLLLLDSASGVWARLGRSDGLSSDQITGMEWVGSEVFVATPEGVDAFDLSTQRIRSVAAESGVLWMTQIHGVLILSTMDGLLRMDPATKAKERMPLPEGVGVGAVRYGRGRLVAGGGPGILRRDVPTFLGDADPVLDPGGFRYRLPHALPAGVEMKAWLRLPEWPASKVDLVVESLDSLWRAVRLPGDLRGGVQLDLVASLRDGSIREIRSMEVVADRSRPSLLVEVPPPVARDSILVVAGTASGVGDLRLQAQGRDVALASDGRFRASLPLRHGRNHVAFSLRDGLGNATAREFEVVYDVVPPRIDRIPVDTVAGDHDRMVVRVAELGEVRASVQASFPARVGVFDSLLVVEAWNLAPGENRIGLSLQDEAGNRDSVELKIFRRTPVSRLDTGLVSAEDLLVARAPWTNGSSRPGLVLAHYRMLEGETLCGVAEKFYGTQGLALVLIRWNGFADSSQWRRMPVGTPVDVPFWTDFEFGRMELREAVATFPWELVPAENRRRK